MTTSRFKYSPIDNKEALIHAVEFVATEASKLYSKITGKNPTITSLTIFSHFSDEFDTLKEVLKEIGESFNENNGPRVVLHEPLQIGENCITHLRVRHPDLERPQVGCCDFDVESFEEFKEKYLLNNLRALNLIKREEYGMIEFNHPDFPEVLGYVISN